MHLRYFSLASAVLGSLLLLSPAPAAVEYFNGFETDISGWDAFSAQYHPTRVSSGTNGIASATGGFHAESSMFESGGNKYGSAGDWGGYNFGGAPVFQEYWTSIDIYLDVNGSLANDTRFDFTSAINKSDGGHLQDFAFNAGFYNDATGPGAGTDRFVISASNNTGRANAYPKNPGRDPIAITTEGWYTFEHHFFDNGGILGVVMSIFDASNNLIHTWSSGAGQAIAGVGGNRYGWFAQNELSTLAFDNTELRTADAGAIPEPFSLAVWGLLSIVGISAGWRYGRNR